MRQLRGVALGRGVGVSFSVAVGVGESLRRFIEGVTDSSGVGVGEIFLRCFGDAEGLDRMAALARSAETTDAQVRRLSLVGHAAIAQAHGGSVHVADSAIGSSFVVRLPAA